MDKKLILVGAVAILMLLTTMVPLFASNTSTAATSYPDAPHTGDAYVGEFWVNELDASEASLGIKSVAEAHVKASFDWIVYDRDSKVRANWTVNVGNSHPWFSISFYLEVYQVDTSNNSLGYIKVGDDWYGLNCSANTSYSENGYLSVSLSKLDLDSNNATLVCTLTAVSTTRKPVAGAVGSYTNLSIMAEDRGVVGVEKDSQPEGDFSYFINQAEEWLPCQWMCIPGYEDTGAADDIFGNQTVLWVGIGMQVANDSNQNNTWMIAQMKVYQYSWFQADIIISNVQSSATWTIQKDEEKAIGDLFMPCHVEAHPNPLHRRPFFVRFVLRTTSGRFFGSGTHFYPAIKDTWTKIVSGKGAAYRIWGIDTPIPLKGWFWAAGKLKGPYSYTLTLNETDDNSSNNSCPTPNVWSWEADVAYHISSLYNVVVTSTVDPQGFTVVTADIKDVIKNGEDEYIYTFAGDRGDNRINLRCGG